MSLISLLLIVSGLLLSAFSLTEYCPSACSAAHSYTLFQLDMGIVGILFFALLVLMHLLICRVPTTVVYSWLCYCYAGLLAAAMGSELWLLWIQHAVIKSWCPVCVGIAAVVFGLCALSTIHALREWQSFHRRMLAKRVAILALMVLTGFASAYAGVSKPDQLAASTNSSSAPDYSLGNSRAHITVYIFTDWFCPACHKIEPVLEKVYPVLAKNCRIFFIDYTIHSASLNYTKYNQQFLINNKSKYMEIRKTLVSMTSKFKDPSLDDINSAMGALGVKAQPVELADALPAMQSFSAAVKALNVEETPTIVISNSKTRKLARLTIMNISERSIVEAVQED